MGIQGAALATVIAQFLSFLFVIGFYLSGRSALKIKLKHFKPAFSIQGEIFKLGFPVFVRQIGVSILAIIVNNSLRYYGSSIHIAAFGVVNRLMAFLLMPLMGISQGLQPIVGYNYGAGKSERVSEVLKKAIFFSTLIAVFSFLLLMFFPGFFLNLFSPDKDLKAIGQPALRIIIMALPLFGLQIVGTMYFLAVGKAVPAMFLGLSRQVIFLIPFILLFPLFFGLKGVWISFPVADTLASLVTVLYLLWDRKKRLSELRRIPAAG
jgi:putative MATE family efflux protein